MLWLAGSLLAIALVLLQPFVTDQWPTDVRTWLGRPSVRFALLLAGYAAVFCGGYVLGRRRRPYSGPAIVFPPGTKPPDVSPVGVAPARMVAPKPDIWEQLGPLQRELLVTIWNTRTKRLESYDAERYQRTKGLSAAEWNTLHHELFHDHGLIGSDWHGGVSLTDVGERVVAEAHRRQSGKGT